MCRLCRAFDTNRQGFLGWFETLVGLACLEPTTPHGGVPAEFRCRYIFRYYDVNCDGLLSWEEFRFVLVFMNIASQKTMFVGVVTTCCGVDNRVSQLPQR